MQEQNLSEEEIMSFPLGGSMGIDKGKEWSEDFWELFNNAPEENAGNDLCTAFKILGTKKTSQDCKGDDAYCYKILYDEINVAASFNISHMYDASRGSFDDVDGVATFPSQDRTKCCLVAQEYYKGLKKAAISPALPGLSSRYFTSSEPLNQLFVGYDMSSASSHPYGEQSPYTSSTHKDTGLNMIDGGYGHYNHEVFAHTYIKFIESTKSKITFPDFEKFYADQLISHEQSSKTIITVTSTKVTIQVDTRANDDSKHKVGIYTCKTCVKDLMPDYTNATSSTSEGDHYRPDGTLESQGYDRDEEGGCEDCVGKLVDYYNSKEGSSDYYSSKLITKI